MSNRLTQIATRTRKDALRVQAMGDVDELNSGLDVLLAEPLPADVRTLLVVIPHELFNSGGDGLESQQRFIHSHHIAIGRFAELPPADQRDRYHLRVALVGAAGQFVVDQDAPHHRAGHGQEVAAVLPGRAAIFGPDHDA